MHVQACLLKRELLREIPYYKFLEVITNSHMMSYIL